MQRAVVAAERKPAEADVSVEVEVEVEVERW